MKLKYCFEMLMTVNNLYQHTLKELGRGNLPWVSILQVQPGFLTSWLVMPNKGMMKHFLYRKLRIIFGVAFDNPHFPNVSPLSSKTSKACGQFDHTVDHVHKMKQ